MNSLYNPRKGKKCGGSFGPGAGTKQIRGQIGPVSFNIMEYSLVAPGSDCFAAFWCLASLSL